MMTFDELVAAAHADPRTLNLRSISLADVERARDAARTLDEFERLRVLALRVEAERIMGFHQRMVRRRNVVQPARG